MLHVPSAACLWPDRMPRDTPPVKRLVDHQQRRHEAAASVRLRRRGAERHAAEYCSQAGVASLRPQSTAFSCLGGALYMLTAPRAAGR